MPKPARPTEDSQSWQVLANFGETGAQGVEYGVWRGVMEKVGGGARVRGCAVAASGCDYRITFVFSCLARGGVVFEVRATELRGGSAGIQNELVGQAWRGGGGLVGLSSGEWH